MTREIQVVGNVASIAIRTWVRNNDKTKARAEEREKNIGWIRRMFTARRVSHAERREEREAAGEDDDEEDETPVVISSSAVTTYPKGTPVENPSADTFCKGASDRRKSGPEQQHDVATNDRSGCQKSRPRERRA